MLLRFFNLYVHTVHPKTLLDKAVKLDYFHNSNDNNNNNNNNNDNDNDNYQMIFILQL